MGVKESLIATAGAGLAFSLLSAQPVMILGVTGPMLVFEESLYTVRFRPLRSDRQTDRRKWGLLQFSKESKGWELLESIPYLPFRFWTSLWCLVFIIVTVAWEGTFLVKFVTRFSDDILLTLLSVIFVAESVFFIQAVPAFLYPLGTVAAATVFERCRNSKSTL